MVKFKEEMVKVITDKTDDMKYVILETAKGQLIYLQSLLYKNQTVKPFLDFLNNQGKGYKKFFKENFSKELYIWEIDSMINEIEDIFYELEGGDGDE